MGEPGPALLGEGPIMPSVLVKFVVPGRLRGKGRPRSAIRRGKSGQQFVQVFTDKDTLNAEAMLRSLAAQAMAGRAPFQGPLILKIAMTLNRPASWSKRKRAETLYPTGKPDLDNVAKLADAWNGIIWGDDSQLCESHIRRSYDDTKGEEATIWVFEPDGAAPQDQPKVPSAATLSLALPLPPAPSPKPATKLRTPSSFKIGERVRSVAVGGKGEFEGTIIERRDDEYTVEEGTLGKPWLRHLTELSPAGVAS